MMTIFYYNEYKRGLKQADKLIATIKRCVSKLPFDYYIDAEVRVHVCSQETIKQKTGYNCCGLTYPKKDGSYDVYVSMVLKEGELTALHELMHVMIFESKVSGLFVTEHIGKLLQEEWHEDYDRQYASTNWMEYLCCSFERYAVSASWRKAHPKTTQFFEMRGFTRR